MPDHLAKHTHTLADVEQQAREGHTHTCSSSQSTTWTLGDSDKVRGGGGRVAWSVCIRIQSHLSQLGRAGTACRLLHTTPVQLNLTHTAGCCTLPC